MNFGMRKLSIIRKKRFIISIKTRRAAPKLPKSSSKAARFYWILLKTRNLFTISCRGHILGIVNKMKLLTQYSNSLIETIVKCYKGAKNVR